VISEAIRRPLRRGSTAFGCVLYAEIDFQPVIDFQPDVDYQPDVEFQPDVDYQPDVDFAGAVLRHTWGV
jgi:hypothetical protein